MRSPIRQFAIGFALFALTICLGVVGYRIAGWSTLDSLYMVVITIFGVGYGEVHEMTPQLRLFTLLFILIGCSILIYTAGALVNWLTEGQLEKLLGKRKMDKQITQLTDHVVICGFGRMGRLLASQLKAAQKPFLIIDQNPKQIELLHDAGYLYIEGDATEESTLFKARIAQASVLATVLPSDAANVFIVLSCRALNPALIIIARANQISSEAKLKQAGTNKVVMPAAIGADRIANMILKPSARDVLEKDLHNTTFLDELEEIGLEMDEIYIPEGSPLVDQTLEALETKGKSAFIVVAVRRASGETTIKPPLDFKLESKDTLVVMSHVGVVPEFVRANLNKQERFYRGIAH